MPLHKLPAHGQPQAAALGSGCVERLEDPRADRRVHPWASIAHRDHHARRARWGLLQGGAQGKPPAVLHGLHRVEDQVQQHLRQLVGIPSYRRQPLGQSAHHIHTLLFQAAPGEHQHALNQLVHSDLRGRERGAMQVEQLAQDIADAPDLLAGQAQVARPLLFVGELPGQVQAALDRLERRVHLVGHGGGQALVGRHTLGRHHLGLQAHLLRHLSHLDHQLLWYALALGCPQRVQIKDARAALLVGGAHPRLARVAIGQARLYQRHREGGQQRQAALAPVVAHQALRRSIAERGEALVHRQHVAIVANKQQAIVQAVEDRTQQIA